MGKCLFSKAWVGRCNEPTEPGKDYCAQHVNEKCCSCGEQATQSCDATLSLVCGAPLCPNCMHYDRGGHKRRPGPKVPHPTSKKENQDRLGKENSRETKLARVMAAQVLERVYLVNAITFMPADQMTIVQNDSVWAVLEDAKAWRDKLEAKAGKDTSYTVDEMELNASLEDLLKDQPPELSLAERIAAVENGRFAELVKTLRIDPACERCSSFNPQARDSYKCYVAGSCIAATLNPSLLSYIQKSLGWVTVKEHHKNLGIG